MGLRRSQTQHPAGHSPGRARLGSRRVERGQAVRSAIAGIDENARTQCQWHCLVQEEVFVARTTEVGDETGSGTRPAQR